MQVKNVNLKMARTLFIMAFFFLLSLSAYSESLVRIKMVNGDKYEIPFSEEPEMTFQNGELNINGLKTSLVLAHSQIDDIQFVKEETGLKNIPEDNVKGKMVWTSPRHLIIYGERISPLRLYSLNGIRINLPYQESTNHIDANFENLSEGVYILSIGDAKTIKIFIKR